MADETWALEVHQHGRCIELAAGSPQVITLAYEQMAAIFPSLPHGFRNRNWTLSVRKPPAGGEEGES